MKLITPGPENIDYELIDTGNGEKLERFGRYILYRPEPQAVWARSFSESDWRAMANAIFKRDKLEPEKGEWLLKPGMPSQWNVSYHWKDRVIQMGMGLTSFKHVGIFPEQAVNWNFIYDQVKRNPAPNPPVLNLFAYTGGASLVAKAAGADVVHVDSVRQVINWAANNMALNKLDGIRWIIEDAMKYVKRELKRGKKYMGIILDPPAYGRGPNGEKWILEDSVNELVGYCNRLLEDDEAFFVMNLYSMGFSSLVADNLVKSNFTSVGETEFGELFFSDRSGKRLPLGVFVRFAR